METFKFGQTLQFRETGEPCIFLAYNSDHEFATIACGPDVSNQLLHHKVPVEDLQLCHEVHVGIDLDEEKDCWLLELSPYPLKHPMANDHKVTLHIQHFDAGQKVAEPTVQQTIANVINVRNPLTFKMPKVGR